MIFGAFSTLFMGLAYYITPRLCGVPMWNGRWGYTVLWAWNLNLAAAFIGVSFFGRNRGWEAGELPLANVVILTVIMFAVTVQMLVTIAPRREAQLYVSLWYLIGALVWTSINLVLLIIGPYHTVPGINNAALHGLYIQGPDLGDQLHQDVLQALDGGEAGAPDPDRGSAQGDAGARRSREGALPRAKCFQCHGDGGKSDGPSADELTDDWGFKILPIDFTRGQFKGGADVRDVFRTMTTGLDGTPMPSFVDSMSETERWAISYYVLSLSAFNDPFTGQKLRLDPAMRARLNDGGEEAYRSSRLALDPSAPTETAPKALVRFHRGLAGEGR